MNASLRKGASDRNAGVLTLDAGNGALKVALWSVDALGPILEGGLEPVRSARLAWEARDFDARLAALLAEASVALVSNVAGSTHGARLGALLAAAGVRDATAPHGLDLSACRDVHTIGADRLWAARGAFERVGVPCLVVDAGTAVTIDAVTNNAVTNSAVTNDAVTKDAVTSDAVTSDAVTSDAVTSDAVTYDAAIVDAETGTAETGTAETGDVGAADPVAAFAGGAIALGPELAARALAAGGADLFEVDVRYDPATVPALGRESAEALRAGVVHGVRGAVRELVELVHREAGLDADAPRLVTGGAAPLLFAEPTVVGPRACYEPWLVHLGLLAAYARADLR